MFFVLRGIWISMSVNPIVLNFPLEETLIFMSYWDREPDSEPRAARRNPI